MENICYTPLHNIIPFRYVIAYSMDVKAAPVLSGKCSELPVDISVTLNATHVLKQMCSYV